MKWNLNSGRFDLTDLGAIDLTDLKDLLNLTLPNLHLLSPHHQNIDFELQ